MGATEDECWALLAHLALPSNTSAEFFLWDTDSWAIAFVFGDGAPDNFRISFRALVPAAWKINWFDAEYRAGACTVLKE